MGKVVDRGGFVEDRVSKNRGSCQNEKNLEREFDKLIKLARNVAYSKGPFDKNKAILALRKYLERSEE